LASISIKLAIWTLHFCLIFPVVMIVISGIKNAFLIPVFGEKRSHIIERLLLIITVFLLSYFFADPELSAPVAALLLTGILWAICSFFIEILVKHILFRERMLLILESYNPLKGNLGMITFFFIMVTPALAVMIAAN